ncbi:MAG: DUF58 domain-containing protein [Planctomycetota bacterium]|nr:MAG: DUF58 domain-containing protein [Planctomycetota bacterium]
MAESSERDPRDYLDPKVLDQIKRLDLRARLVVEGFVAGMHKSPYRGYSVEFAQHREYVPGDDIRFLDWKVFGKSDRLYVKEFEEETNLKAHIFLDQSESMSYGSERRKFDYAATMAASLGFLIQQQADSVALELFDEGLLTQIPPSNSRAQVNKILKALSEAQPSGKTKIGRVLNELAEKQVRKGLVIVISDLFDEPEEILAALKHLRHRGQDVLLFHVLDRDEVDFPFQRMTLFEGMEAMPELLCDPKSLREAYLAEVQAFEEQVRKGCQAQKVDYQRVITDQPLDVVLTTYLARRAALSKAARR